MVLRKDHVQQNYLGGDYLTQSPTRGRWKYHQYRHLNHQCYYRNFKLSFLRQKLDDFSSSFVLFVRWKETFLKLKNSKIWR